METKNLLQLVANLITAKRFTEAENALLRARADATSAQDPQAQQAILLELVDLYRIMEPPDLVKAERLSNEMESLTASASSKLQTAMLLYWASHEPVRALAKLQEAIEKGSQEGDFGTVYSSLCLQGLALLDLNRNEEAKKVLAEIRNLIARKKSFVPGDETSFLEEARKKGIDAQSIREIASSLIPICRDPSFARRLEKLAKA